MVTVRSTCLIKPATQTPNGALYLSDCDMVSAITHAPTVYAYPKPSPELLPFNPAETLKDSLSKALAIFYPLAGRLQYISSGRLELDCNAAGARFVEAESQAELRDLGDFCPSPKLTSEVIAAVDRGPLHEQPLLLVQLTTFKCGGMCLGLGISHTVADGQAALHFVSEWARIARGEQPQNLPFLDRTILRVEDGSLRQIFEHIEYTPPPILIGRSDNLEERKKQTTVAVLKLSDLQIIKLREKANHQALPAHNGRSRPVTRYEAVSAHVWRCACKARRHVSEQPTRLRVTVNFRNRLVPPLSPWYFGNAVVRAVVSATSGDLVSKELGYASSKIRSTVESLNDQYLRSSFVFLKGVDDFTPLQNFHTLGCPGAGFFGNPNVEITSWIGLPLMIADFGWGKPVHMGPGAIGFDGKCFIVPGPDGDGSLTIAIRLQEEHMGDFQKFFYDGI